MQLVRTVAPYGRTASFLSAIASALILIYPKVSISAGVNLDPSTPFGTTYFIKNEGHVPLKKVSFICSVTSAKSSGLNLKNVGFAGLSKPVELWPGKTVTRDCRQAVGGFDGPLELDVIVEYDYYIPIISGKSVVHFSSRHGPNGFVMVPDLE